MVEEQVDFEATVTKAIKLREKLDRVNRECAYENLVAKNLFKKKTREVRKYIEELNERDSFKTLTEFFEVLLYLSKINTLIDVYDFKEAWYMFESMQGALEKMKKET